MHVQEGFSRTISSSNRDPSWVIMTQCCAGARMHLISAALPSPVTCVSMADASHRPRGHTKLYNPCAAHRSRTWCAASQDAHRQRRKAARVSLAAGLAPAHSPCAARAAEVRWHVGVSPRPDTSTNAAQAHKSPNALRWTNTMGPAPSQLSRRQHLAPNLQAARARS